MKRPQQAITPQVTGGWSRKDRTEKSAIPARLPRMSSRYALSGRNRMKSLATPWPSPAMTATVSRKTRPKLSGCGSARDCPTPEKISGPPAPECRTTGNSRTNPTSATNATGVQRR
jgi:hypothetical protein